MADLPLFIGVIQNCMDHIYLSVVEMIKRVHEAIGLALNKLEIPKDANIISCWQKSFLVDSELDIVTREIKLLSAWRHGVFCIYFS